jgi:uncharacterized protein YbaP (TraB family)
LFGILATWLAAGSIPKATAGETATPRGILYEIRSPTGVAPSFLFGTIHSEDKRVLDLPVPVRSAFEASANVALEVVPDASAIINAMATMAYTDGRRLRDVLPEDLYRETATALGTLGMTEDALENLKPWAVVTLLGSPPSETAIFQEVVIDARNRRMAERMAPLLAEGDWFIAIGALHLPGDEGIVELLRRRGHDVTIVF